MAKITLTRPTTTRRLSTWEVPLAKSAASNFACEGPAGEVFKVLVLDVNPIVSENHNIVYYKCDISKWDAVEAVSKKIVEEIGHPTVLVNNAGVVQGKLVTDLSAADVQQWVSG
ncbi:retinal short-chain dehydrogenase reductase [Lentinula edodes]|uniref:Retinal short-chain dehydrogenase reductase n=1 Tax=Lentinula edodes TaxID=5353 RepID=A0A1Q3E5X0_LENED|nr:retinal short-chain dehydrogenase reductase [Lentinula edodes]